MLGKMNKSSNFLLLTIFLGFYICYTRIKNNHFSSYHHFGFEAASWYWHFVDIVWLFLYVCIYWFGK